MDNYVLEKTYVSVTLPILKLFDQLGKIILKRVYHYIILMGKNVTNNQEQ